MQLGDEAAGDNQRGDFVFDEKRHDLHDRRFHIVGQIEFRVPRDGGFGIPLRGDRLRVNPRGVIGPHLDLVDKVEIEFRRAGLDHRSTGRKPPTS